MLYHRNPSNTMPCNSMPRPLTLNPAIPCHVLNHSICSLMSCYISCYVSYWHVYIVPYVQLHISIILMLLSSLLLFLMIDHVPRLTVMPLNLVSSLVLTPPLLIQSSLFPLIFHTSHPLCLPHPHSFYWLIDLFSSTNISSFSCYTHGL